MNLLLYLNTSLSILKMHYKGAIFLILMSLNHTKDSLPVSYASEFNMEFSKKGIPKIKTSSKIKKYLSPLTSRSFDFPIQNKTIETISTGVITQILNQKNKKGIAIKHVYLENGKADTIYSVYKQIEINPSWKVGDTLPKNYLLSKNLGNFTMQENFELRKRKIGNLQIFLSNKEKGEYTQSKDLIDMKSFIPKHKNLTCPHKENKLLIAIKSEYKIYFIQKGKITKILEIALGQSPKGHKVKQGDNKTPEGEYRLSQKAKGPFSGTVGPYFGERWIRLSYPNAYDAEIGYKRKLISKAEKEQIENAIKNNQMPPKNTQLGGGIGIHGWSGEWDPNQNRDLTWGCISINNSDLIPLYDQLEVGDKIIISP
ncbi:MAG: L,D-transpeptidase [Crocinitomicaceae bacterium]